MASDESGASILPQHAPTESVGTVAQGRQGRALLLLCMAQFMLVLDIAIVNVALPRVQADLHFSSADLQLVVTAYGLTFGGLLLLGGRVTDLLGRRRIFISGLVLFTLASLSCGLAQSAAMLVAARALQGVGGAMLSPAALSLLVTIFPEGTERNRALGVWSALAAGGGAAGLLIGGVLTDLVSWRWVFLVNVPIGLLVLLASFSQLPEGRGASRGRIDIAGAITVTLGLIALVYGLSRGGQQGFGDGIVIALLLFSMVLITAFVIIELRVQDPLVPFGIFRLRTLSGANLATLLLSAVILGVNYFLTLYFQQVLAFSPFVTGLAFLPMTLASVLASWIAARLVARLGTRPLLLAGMLALAGGTALLSQIAPGGSYLLAVLPGLLFVAVGLGVGFTLGTLAATAGVSADQQGVASGILSTSQQLGGSLGLAVLTAIASMVTVSTTGAPLQTLTAGFRVAFLVSSGFALLAAIVVALLVRERDCRQELARREHEPGSTLVSGNAQAAPCQPAVASITVARSQLQQS